MYRTLWNALRKIVAPYSTAERDQMFRATAAGVYRLDG
jgi:predicted TIM-barrel fold metal-dependent hydrolase